MQPAQKATRIDLFQFRTPQMRAFHMTWLAFFTAFFGWFGIAPLMAVVSKDLQLTKAQVGNTLIASVLITVLVRIIIGPLCTKLGPRLCYTFILTIGSLPVMLIGLANSYETFLLFRLAIGAIGAAFVVSQFHTSQMFAPNCVGLANATTAGWGNMGGGVTNIVMPLIFAAIVSLGVSEHLSWRLAMVIPGLMLFSMGIAYYFLTQDTPAGNLIELRAAGQLPDAPAPGATDSTMWSAVVDYRVWLLALAYAACFGLEITIHGVAAMYYKDNFELDLRTAGLVAGTFGLLNLFARALGGYLSDWCAKRWSLSGRVNLLFVVLAGEGLTLLLFSRMGSLPLAIATMVLFGLFVKMSTGATYGVVPFVNKRQLGTVAGIVGAGGNIGAVCAGFLFRVESLSMGDAFWYLGLAVFFSSLALPLIRFSKSEQTEQTKALELAMQREPAQPEEVPAGLATAK